MASLLPSEEVFTRRPSGTDATYRTQVHQRIGELGEKLSSHLVEFEIKCVPQLNELADEVVDGFVREGQDEHSEVRPRIVRSRLNDSRF